MIEEIKKEIDKLPLYAKSTPRPTVDYLDVIEILDKYQLMYPDYKNLLYKNDSITTELQNYKSACEELFNFYAIDLKDMYSKNDVMVLGRLKDLIKKYNLGGE